MSQWQELQDKHAALTMREKGLILVSTIVAIVFILGHFLIEPQLMDLEKNQDITRSIGNNITETINGRRALEQKIATDPQGQLAAELAALVNSEQQLTDTLALRGASFISSGEMTTQLQHLVAEQKGLTVEKLTSLMPKAILFEQKTDDTQQPKPLLYRHSVKIEVSGGYVTVVKFLQRIEQQNRFLLWGDIQYVVTEHPTALVTFVVSTLSSDKEFIGVK